MKTKFNKQQQKTVLEKQLVFTSEEQIQQVQSNLLKSGSKLGFGTLAEQEEWKKFRIARDSYRKRVQNTPTLKEALLGIAGAIAIAPLVGIAAGLGPFGMLIVAGAIRGVEPDGFIET